MGGVEPNGISIELPNNAGPIEPQFDSGKAEYRGYWLLEDRVLFEYD